MINVFKKIWDFSLKEKRNLQKSMVIGFLNAICNSLLVLALYVVLKAIVENQVSTRTAWTAFAIMVLSIIGKIITQYFSQLQRTHAGYFMVADKRISIGEKLKRVPMGYFNQNSLGQITAIETTILNDVETAVPVVLVTTLGGFLNSLVFALFILLFDWRMGLITLFGIVIFLFITSAMEKKSREGVPARQETQAVLVEAVLETIQGTSVVKAFDLEHSLDKKVDKAIEESFRKNERLEKAMTPYVAMQQLVLNMFSVLLMFCAIAFYLDGSMELTNSLIMVVCSFLVYEQLKVAGSCVANMRIAEHSIDKANKIDEVPTMEEGKRETSPASMEIRFSNVDFAYEKKKILNHVSFTIPEKKMTAIVGPSGSGKTTLCRLIPRFWDVDAGTVSIGGVDVKDYTMNSLMKNISMVFQNVYLFADTIENNIKFGKVDATYEEVVEAAKRACCHDFIMALPQGYQTRIGEGGASLSGGEKQRISIARALIKDAQIVIFDEVTANVDPENEDRLQKAIEELTRDKTVIMIAHRLKTVRNAEKILVLDHGEIVQEGRHETLIKEKGLYADFVETRKEAIGWKLGRQ
ncbi:ABC transporter ATP-binding protein [Blautia faecis]|uniref:ABC transporter ATP-binding protein n=1 Tax=Blautia faecis TaxID=871665 RepID=UPI001654EE63|nr:ABC transporter ATP-binding protein [Blautia faecis]MBC8615414.1 ABC transporter ATP-binding protein [Blautia faecis]